MVSVFTELKRECSGNRLWSNRFYFIIRVSPTYKEIIKGENGAFRIRKVNTSSNILLHHLSGSEGVNILFLFCIKKLL